MRPVLVFLDVPGVLDNPNTADYSRVSPLRLLEASVLLLPEVYLVFGFESADEAPVKELISQCSAELRERVAGLLVHMPGKKPSRGSREQVAKNWMQLHDIHNPQWVAVDDAPHLWQSLHQVVDVNPDVGFNEDVAVRLSAMIALWRLPADPLEPVVSPLPSSRASTSVPLGIRVKHATIVEWTPTQKKGLIQLSGESQELAFEADAVVGLENPSKGMKVHAWLNKRQQVVRLLPHP